MRRAPRDLFLSNQRLQARVTAKLIFWWKSNRDSRFARSVADQTKWSVSLHCEQAGIRVYHPCWSGESEKPLKSWLCEGCWTPFAMLHCHPLVLWIVWTSSVNVIADYPIDCFKPFHSHYLHEISSTMATSDTTLAGLWVNDGGFSFHSTTVPCSSTSCMMLVPWNLVMAIFPFIGF